MAGKRKAEASSSSKPKVKKPKLAARVSLKPLEPFSVDALRSALAKEEAVASSSTQAANGPSVLELLELELATLDESWMRVLETELRQSYFHDLKRFLWRLGLRAQNDPKLRVFPMANDIYTWSRHTPLEKVRVVVLGQDPYHNDGQAHGLSFSVRHGIAVPASLKNIYKELATEYPGFKPPSHGNLESWAKQGVLLLNASLTVTAHEAASHAGQGWEEFTSAVVRAIDQTEGVVFLAWGKPAEKAVANVDRKKHLVLTSAHPSPLSAMRGFFGNNHFVKANDWLREKYGEAGTIDWCNLDSAKSAAAIHAPANGVNGASASQPPAIPSEQPAVVIEKATSVSLLPEEDGVKLEQTVGTKTTVL